MATRTPRPTSFATSSTTTRYRHRDWDETTTSTSMKPVAPLTTRFPAPANCFDNFHLANYSISNSTGITTYETATILNANTTGVYSSECWPSGFRTAQFRPGVCPSGWIYYNIHTSYGIYYISVSNTSIYETQTLADCCASGFSKTERKDSTETGPIDGCYQKVKDRHTTLDGLINGTATAQFTGGFLRHEPLRIEWAGLDANTLSPSPPQLTKSNRYVPTWVPGTEAKLRREQNVEGDSDNDPWGPIIRFVQIGVPLISVFLICSCFVCCLRCRRSRRREKRRKCEQRALPDATRRRLEEEDGANAVAAVEASLVADAEGDAELAQAIELIERQQTEEAAAVSTTVSTTASTASPPRYSVKDADDEAPPAYQKTTSTN